MLNKAQMIKDQVSGPISKCVNYIGGAKDVLLLCCTDRDLLPAFEESGRTVTSVRIVEEDTADGVMRKADVSFGSVGPLKSLNRASFDAVIFDGVPLGGEMRQELLSRAGQLLRAGGIVVVRLDTKGHIRISHKALRQMLSEMGYNIEKAERSRKTYMIKGRRGTNPSGIIPFPSRLSGTTHAEVAPTGKKKNKRLKRKHLVAALREAIEASEALELRVRALAKEKNDSVASVTESAVIADLRSTIYERGSECDALRKSVHSLRVRVFDLEEQRRSQREAVARSEEQFETEHAQRLRLQIALALSRLITAKVEARTVAAEAAWFDLYAELEDARVGVKQLYAEAFGTIEEAHEECAAARAEADAQVKSAAARVRQLESEVSHGAGYVHNLLEQIAAKDRQIEDQSVRAHSMEERIMERSREIAMLAAEIEAIRKSAISEKMVMLDYTGTLREEVAVIPRLREAHNEFVAQTEQLISSLQTESAQLVTLIDTVQSGKFWRIKHFLLGMRSWLAGRKN